jgi:hypothetical protein
MVTADRPKYAMTLALLDLYNHPYSMRLTRFVARQMVRARNRGCPSILD